MKGLIIFLSLCGAFLLFVAADIATGETKYSKATVIDKHYEPSHHSTGTGYGMTMDGSFGIVSTSSHEAEKWSVIAELSDGRIESFSVSGATFYSKNKGDTVPIKTRYGGITGCPWYQYLTFLTPPDK